MSRNRPPRVFISYSHDSEEHAGRVLGLADRLRGDGVDARIDQYETAPKNGWPRWMEEQVEEAGVVLCLCTETYRRRFDQKEHEGRGLGVTWEAGLVRIALYLDQGQNQKFFPLLFDSSDIQYIPTPLQAPTRFVVDSDVGYTQLYRHLTHQPEVSAPPLGKIRILPRRSLFGKNVSSAPTEQDPDSGPLTEYEKWAREKYSHLELIGIDAGDVKVQLDEVYVPLRVHHQPELDDTLGLFRGLGRGGRLGFEGEVSGDVEIENVLREQQPAADGQTRHALIFGEPGSGKTTALLKLHQLCWDSPTNLGLAEETVPVFLRLRHLTPERLDQPLASFLEHEVKQRSGGRLADFGEKLWQHRHLLLLCDGLDEIADANHRAEVLRRLGWILGHDDARHMRAVVSCRRVGLPGRDADRDRRFQTFEVRPFDDEQIARLVDRWFRELARRGRIDSATADRRVTTIVEALEDPKQANQQILQMVSNPLLLTLLCVVVLLGNEIPRKRVRFFEQCLDVLLDRWPRQRGEEGPVDLTTARAALAHLAFHLHVHQRRDDLGWAEAVATLMDSLGEGADADAFFDWVHEQVGLLVDYTEEEFGFVHLGLQEHLTARHLVAQPEALDFLEGDFDETWWTEVFLQVCALSERSGFDALMLRLLFHTNTLERRSGLLRECLGETVRPELAAFVRALREGDAERQQAVMRLLGTQRNLPTAMVEVLEELAGSGSKAVAFQARGLLSNASDPGAGEGRLALLIATEADRLLADDLCARLMGWQGGWPSEVLVGTGKKNGKKLRGFHTILPLIGEGANDTSAWNICANLRKICGDTPWLPVTLPADSPVPIPEVFGDCDSLGWTLGEEDDLLASIVRSLPSALPEPMSEPKPALRSASLGVSTEPSRKRRSRSLGSAPNQPLQPFVEKTTGMEFLPVPGGSFVMGDDDLWTEEEKKIWRDADLEWVIQAPTPAVQVRLSPFWLAKTPVTNRQYALFLEATEHQQPETWRDRRFSDPEQPVVNVSWEDATAYCRWLQEREPGQRVFQLPSEAQWEFAARGPKSRRFPWGENTPNPSLACFGLDQSEGKPAEVGSYSAGAGPFGHLDLAGLVWEWCRDAWEPDHSRWVDEESLDPIGKGDEAKRPLRGGSWIDVAVDLRSAFRHWDPPRFRYGSVGFRVLCVPPSTLDL